MSKLFLNFFVLFLLFSGNAVAQTPAQTVPVFTFFKLDKTALTEKDVTPGKNLFFLFFDTGCAHCQHAVAYINQHYADFKNTELYLVSLDEPEKIKLFMKTYGPRLEHQPHVTVLQDVQNQFISVFRPRRYPSLYLYSSNKELLLYEDNEQNLFRFSNVLNGTAK